MNISGRGDQLRPTRGMMAEIPIKFSSPKAGTAGLLRQFREMQGLLQILGEVKISMREHACLQSLWLDLQLPDLPAEVSSSSGRASKARPLGIIPRVV